MNSDEKRLLRHLESYNIDNPTLYTYIYNYYTPRRLAERALTPGFLIPLSLLAVLLYHHFSSERTGLENLSQILWDGLVRIIPARLLYAIDSWLNPPLFPLPMLQTQTRNTSHAAKSEVLKRVLGMDKAGGIMASVSQAGRRSLSGLSGPSLTLFKGDPDKPAGLGNISNSCYQNSVLQGLGSLRPLPTYLASVDREALTDKKAGTIDTLRQLVADLNSTSNNDKTLWTPSVLKSMSTWQQQDAQEYFSKLLDEVDREMARLLAPLHKPAGYESEALQSSKDDTAASQHSDDSGYLSMTHSKSGLELRLARNPLEGLQAQRVACTACGHSDGLSMIPFNCLTLNLGTDGREHDLYERLDSYTKVESIPGVECAKCTLLKYQKLVGKLIAGAEAKGTTEAQWPEPFARLRAINEALEEDDFEDGTLQKKCKIRPEHKVASTKTKQAVIARPPRSLVVHMNRSVFDETTGRMWKNLAAVRFPTLLDLGPWCLGSAHAPQGKEDESEQWLLDPGSSMIAGGDGESKISGPLYELRAVITHYGRHENGHYVCYRRHGKRKERGKEVEEKPAQLAGDKEGMHDVDGVAGRQGSEEVQGIIEREEEREDKEGTQWWRLSDQDVSMVDEEEVVAQSGVFMLFYDCVDPNSTLTTAEVDHFVDSVSALDAAGTRPNAIGSAVSKDAPEGALQGPSGDATVSSLKEGVEGERTTESAQSSEHGDEDSSGEDPQERTEVKHTTAVEAAPAPPTRAEMIARAKVLFARTAERAGTIPLPDEEDDL
jgi:ubiquitin carboxyl-terminal hydrolase 1